MRAMQVERGKTRPQTLMTGHTGYITHARKILKPTTQETKVILLQEALSEEPVVEEQENSEEMAEEDTA